jgi:hypothetical protein
MEESKAPQEFGEPLEFEGGEAPCSEGCAPEPGSDAPSGEPVQEAEASEPPRPATEAAEKSEPRGSGGITQEELNEMMQQIPPEILAPDLPMLLASMVAALEEQAMRHLGLVMNPVTRTVEKDLQKAKIAIDVMSFITTQVSPLVTDTQRRDLQNKVATLQLNFVQQSRPA